MNWYLKTKTWLLCAGFCSSCCTPALWEATDPAEHVAIPVDRVSEGGLKAKHLKYYKDETRNLFYVEKRSARKLGDYAIRALATPVTVVIDAVTTVVVVCGFVFAAENFDEKHYDYMMREREGTTVP